MIYYFSGTGNSRHIAQRLAGMLAQASPSCCTASDECAGLVFPVYAWGIPNVVERFARTHREALRHVFLYAVMTCGDDTGYADRILEKALGRRLDAAFSVQMPNTYVCLPGFDVDDDMLCSEKVGHMDVRLGEIAKAVQERMTVRRLERGSFPWTKTYLLRPLFNRFLLTDKYFKADASRCVSCRLCEGVCPVSNIRLEGEAPVWQGHCSGCLACYHVCPQHAICFAGLTAKKGQYRSQNHLQPLFSAHSVASQVCKMQP